jgi:hypothetical protein
MSGMVAAPRLHPSLLGMPIFGFALDLGKRSRHHRFICKSWFLGSLSTQEWTKIWGAWQLSLAPVGGVKHHDRQAEILHRWVMASSLDLQRDVAHRVHLPWQPGMNIW